MRINDTLVGATRRLTELGLAPQRRSPDQVLARCPGPRCNGEGSLTVEQKEGYEGVEFTTDCFDERDDVRIALGYTPEAVLSQYRAGYDPKDRRNKP
jgi:hypothetical protein